MTILVGDCRDSLRSIKAGSVQTCITSPPYFGLRDYGHDGQIGLEQTPEDYVAGLVEVFRLVRDALADDGTLWLNIGDSYFGTGKGPTAPTGLHGKNGTPYPIKGVYTHDVLKGKDLIGIPWRVAFALQADGWYLRSDIIWHKPNPMPESVTDRPTKSHEYLFLLSKSLRYYYDHEAIKEPAIDGTTRNKRDVWTITTKPFKGAHFAVMPEALVEPCILAGSKPGDTVLDPFAGSGTVGVVAKRHGRNFVGAELNPDYAAMAETRIASESTNLFTMGTR
jgi:DNA modification methylase